MEDSFSTDQGAGDGLGMIQAHYIYCALYFEPDATADPTGGTGLWSRGGGPLA